MITLQFPKLEGALAKNTKNMAEDDPRRGIIVIDSNAIVYDQNFCLVINLYDYFTIDCEIHDDGELKELKRIMAYMNEKVFSAEYWKELTKGANMKMFNGMLSLEAPKYAKDLHYKPLELNLLDPLRELIFNSKESDITIPAISIPFEPLSKIYNVLKADFKTDHIIFEFAGQNKPVKFTFRDRKHVFGYVVPHYDSAVESWKFDTWESFVKSEDVQDLYEDAKENIPPPPVEAEVVTEEEDEDQANLFAVAEDESDREE